MNKREVFDKVAKHLLDQGTRSKEPGGMCAYRGPNGLTCAVGCLIPDDLYDKGMEGRGVESLLNTFPSMYKLFGEHHQLLGSLQSLHDHGAVVEWEERLDKMRETL